jgi:lysophospholipase L1-like esterase
MKRILFLFCFVALILFGFYTCSASTKEMNLVALGDSITHGTGDPSRKGYIGIVKTELEEKKGIPVQVRNFAVPKYTTENILSQLQDREIRNRIQKADYLILYIGTNDFRKSAGYDFNQLHVKKINVGKSHYSTNLHEILEKMRKENSAAPILVLGLYHPYEEYPNQLEILELIEQWNTEIITVIGEFDQTYFVPTLDLFQNKPKEVYFHDSLHPNKKGYQQIAERLYDKLIKLE